MRETHFVLKMDFVSGSDALRGRRPFTHSVDGQDRGFFERRAIEGTRGVRQVVVAKHDAVAVNVELLADDRLDPKLVEEPRLHRGTKNGDTLRKGSQRG